MTDTGVAPEATLSAMSRVTKDQLDLEQYAAQQGATGAALDAIGAPVARLIEQDPEAYAARHEVTSALAALPREEGRLGPDALMANRLRGAAAGTLRVRGLPFDYTGKNGNVSTSSNAATGTLSIGGSAGQITGGQGDIVTGVTWLGIAINAASAGAHPGQRIRVSPSVTWDAGWQLSVAGIGELGVGAHPWADCRGGVNLLVFGPNGLVTQTGRQQMFEAHHSGAPGASWNRKEGSGGGYAPPLHVWFDIPAGQTRWINVDAYIEARTNYSSVWNLAAAHVWLDATVKFFVLDPE